MRRLAVGLLGLLVAGQAVAGAWTKDLGSYYTKAGADGFYALSWAQSGVDARGQDRFLGQLYSVYGEAGLLKAYPVQIAASVPLSVGTLWFVRRDNGTKAAGRATVHRMGDVRLRPQVALHPDKPIALAVEVKIPGYRVDSVCDENPTFIELCPRPGDGQIDIQPMLLGGGSVGKKGFAELGVGYRHRTETFLGWDTDFEFGDSVAVEAGGGAWAGKLLLMGKVDANVLFKPDNTSAQFVRLGPSALFDVTEGLAIEARTQADVWAVNTARGLGFGLGLSARR